MDLIERPLVNVGKLVTFPLVDNLMGESFVPNAMLVPEADVLRLEYLVVDALIHALLQVCGVGRAG